MKTSIDDLKIIRERKAAALEKARKNSMTSDQLDAQVQEYLAKGGTIEVIPVSVEQSFRGKRW